MPSFVKVTRILGRAGGLAGAPGAARGGLRSGLALAAGYVHRHLIGLGRDHPAVDEQGVLPVWSGRLKNSFYTPPVEGQGNSLVSAVVSNIEYGALSNERHDFLGHTVDDTRKRVNSLVRGELGNSLHG